LRRLALSGGLGVTERDQVRIVQLLLAGLAGTLCHLALDLPTPFTGLAVWLGLFAALVFFRVGHAREARGVLMPWLAIPLLLMWSYAFVIQEFGKADYAAIRFHLQVGIERHGAKEAVYHALLYTAGAGLMIAAFAYLLRLDAQLRRVDRLAALALLVANPVVQAGTEQAVAQAYIELTGLDTLLSRNYQKPEIIAPSKKKNIVILYAESLERTYAAPEFDGVYRPIARIAAQGIEFTNILEAANTHWTVAGMVSSQCGIPTFLPNVLGRKSFEGIEAFLPGVKCLGDLIQADGYQLAFVGGADLNFSGKGAYYRTHGFQRILGVHEYGEVEKKRGHVNEWGLYDDTMFAKLKATLREYHQSQLPFAIAALTLATHGPDGNPTARCRARFPGAASIRMNEIVRCSAEEIGEFYDEIKKEGLLENTIFVVASDHLSLKTSTDGLYRRNPDERKNTLIVVTPEGQPRVVNKIGSTIDTFPTLLEFLGYTLPNRQAGLGVSLLSDRPTLMEALGQKQFDRAIQHEGQLNRIAWSSPTR
jgi:phosphoglycerol transferase